MDDTTLYWINPSNQRQQDAGLDYRQVLRNTQSDCITGLEERMDMKGHSTWWETAHDTRPLKAWIV